MKRFFGLCALALLLALSLPAMAQEITMENAYLTFDYPDDWLVVSPQLAGVYAPLLQSANINAEELARDLSAQGVLSRAYNADFTQYLSILTREDDLAAEIYDMTAVTDAQRKTIRKRAESGSLFETTNMTAVDVEWQKENGVYWLYIHYTKSFGEQIAARGVRYLTIFNGRYVMIDWQKTDGRFSNRDLTTARSRIADLSVEKVAAPTRTVRLIAEIPAETNTAAFEITGTTTGGATLIAEAPDETGAMQTLSVGIAKDSGSFSLLVELPAEGAYAITLTASKDSMHAASTQGTIQYSAKTLPVTGIAEQITTTSDTTIIKGETLAGVQLQLVTPFGLSKKKAGNDGSFKFELTTKDEGEYEYTLILDKSGYDQRRVRFTITREVTQTQEQNRIKSESQAISYKNLQKDLEENRGKTMTIRGPVTQVSSGGGVYYVRMQYNKDASSKWYNPVIIAAAQDMGVKEGQILTAVVSVAGVYEEQDSLGETVLVPKLDLVFVDQIE